ncbi:MAG: YHS domain-containing (seleno)protein [Pseudomonadota bacterium]
MPKLQRRAFLTLAATAFVAGSAYTLWPSGLSAANQKIFTGSTPGVAINGYDTVAYHTQGKPVQGKAEHAYRWGGFVWHFASAENVEKFSANPAKYAPQYGGYCAYAAAKGYVAKTEPDAFSLVNGKLYLNYDLNVKKLWDGNKTAFIQDADKKWPEVSKQ